MAESAAALEKSDHEADEADEKAQHWPVHGPRISAADIGYALLPGSVPVLSPVLRDVGIRGVWPRADSGSMGSWRSARREQSREFGP